MRDQQIIKWLIFQTKEEEEQFNKKRSKKCQKKYDERKKTAKVEPALEDQFLAGRVLGELDHMNSRILCVHLCQYDDILCSEVTVVVLT